MLIIAFVSSLGNNRTFVSYISGSMVSFYIFRAYIFGKFSYSISVLALFIMEAVLRTFLVGQCVYAKMKFSPPWPAVILELKGRQARVQFFGWFNQ